MPAILCAMHSAIMNFVLLLLLQSSIQVAGEHILFNLARGGTQCFTTTTTAHSALSAEIRVLNGNAHMPIGFWLLVGATNQILRTRQDVDQEKFSLPAPAGPHHGHDEKSAPAEYRLCVFQRGGTRDGDVSESRKVYLSFSAEGDVDAFDERGAAREVFKGKAQQSDVEYMQMMIGRAERMVDGIRSEIDNIRDREQSMFEITVRVGRQIWVMGFVTCVAVVAGGVLQIRQTQQELRNHGKRIQGDGRGSLGRLGDKTGSMSGKPGLRRTRSVIS